MTQDGLTEIIFLSLLAAFGVYLMFSALTRKPSDGKRIVTDGSGHIRAAGGADATVIAAMLSDLSQKIKPQEKNLEDRLRKSGWVYETAAEYHSRRMTTALIMSIFALFIGTMLGLGAMVVAVLATGGAIFGFTAPDRKISSGLKNRRSQIQREMGFGLDRIALLLSSGAAISEALARTQKVGLFGECCAYLSNSIRTNQPIQQSIQVIKDSLPETQEMTNFLELLKVGMIQGQDLTNSFRQVAEMMRERLSNEIVEVAQRTKIQVTALTSGFIVVATLIVAVGPAVQTLMGSGMF